MKRVSFGAAIAAAILLTPGAIRLAAADPPASLPPALPPAAGVPVAPNPTANPTAAPYSLPGTPVPPGPDAFDLQVSRRLLKLGIGPFNQSDASNATVNVLPSYRPFQIHVGQPYGQIYGMAEILFGFAVAGTNYADDPNVELVATLNDGNHLRGHIQANLLRIPYTSLHSRTIGVPEIYGEYYTDGQIGGKTPSGGANYHLSARLGKVGQVQFPFIDPATLFDRLPGGFSSYTGVLGTGELDGSLGDGVHASAFHRIGNGSAVGETFINDAYGLYRNTFSGGKFFYEGRLGWVPRVLADSPENGQPGAQGYAGVQYAGYGGGVFVSQSFRRGTTVGVGITLARSPASELLGLAPSRLLFEPGSFAIEAPVAQMYLMADSKPAPGETLVGQYSEIHMWNDGTGTGVGTTDVMPVGQWGVQSGSGVHRVVSASPWWLYEDNFQQIPDVGTRRTKSGGENMAHFRSDVKYSYYQRLPQDEYRLTVTTLDAGTLKPVRNAVITLTGPNSLTINSVGTTDAGSASVAFAQQVGTLNAFHISAVAPGYMPVMTDVTLKTGSPNTLVLQLPLRLTTISGTVKDLITGQPVQTAEIILILNDDPGQHTVVTTDDRGMYQLTNVRPGSYTLKLHKPGFNDQTQSVNVTGEPVTIDISTAAQNGGIVGHVIDAVNNPITGALITITDVNGKVLVSPRPVGGQGNFVERVVPGIYTVGVTAAGYLPGSATVTIGAGQLQNVTLTLQKRP